MDLGEQAEDVQGQLPLSRLRRGPDTQVVGLGFRVFVEKIITGFGLWAYGFRFPT